MEPGPSDATLVVDHHRSACDRDGGHSASRANGSLKFCQAHPAIDSLGIREIYWERIARAEVLLCGRGRGHRNVGFLGARFGGRSCCGQRRNQIAHRQNRRYVCRLNKASLVDEKEAKDQATQIQKVKSIITHNKTVVITGGTGGLGLHIAEVLADHEVQNIVLLSRSGAQSQRAISVIESLQKCNVNIQVVRGDVNKAEISKTLDWIDQHVAPIASIIHTAGLVRDGVVLQQTWDNFAAVLLPKVQGTWNLHRWSIEHRETVQSFVVFSSIAALFGSPGQANYSAANAFMDALCKWRKAHGYPATSIDWGLWSGEGMASNGEVDLVTDTERRGYGTITPDFGKQTLLSGLWGWQYGGQRGVVAMDLEKIAAKAQYQKPWPFYSNLIQTPMLNQTEVEEAASHQQSQSQLLTMLSGASKDTWKAMVERMVSECAQTILPGIKSNRASGAIPLREMGMDSLTALEIRNTLSNLIGETLPATLVYDYPTIVAIAEFIMKEYGQDVGGGSKHIKGAKSGMVVAQSNDVAIVGVSARFPGHASDCDAFWKVLHGGVDAVTEVPHERWDIDEMYDADPLIPNKMNTRSGGFIDGVDLFDADFFGVAPREALFMDPQQGLLLELGWKAFEDTGYAISSLQGSNTGVFVGATSGEY